MTQEAFALYKSEHPELQTLAHLDAPAASHLHGLNEMSEAQSLGLQMAMDRLSELTSAISNALKKADGTSSAVIQNIK